MKGRAWGGGVGEGVWGPLHTELTLALWILRASLSPCWPLTMSPGALLSSSVMTSLTSHWRPWQLSLRGASRFSSRLPFSMTQARRHRLGQGCPFLHNCCPHSNHSPVGPSPSSQPPEGQHSGLGPEPHSPTGASAQEGALLRCPMACTSVLPQGSSVLSHPQLFFLVSLL